MPSDVIFPDDLTPTTPEVDDALLISDTSAGWETKQVEIWDLPISSATQLALNNKVDKIVWKWLSINDYDNTEKSINNSAIQNIIAWVNTTVSRSWNNVTINSLWGWWWIVEWQPLINYFTATAGQTVFDLTFTYTPWNSQLWVFLQWNKVEPTITYSETDGNTITFLSWLDVWDLVVVASWQKWVDWVWVISWWTTGQVLAKNSNTDYDTEWIDAWVWDMLKATYDPINIEWNAFDLKNQSWDYTKFNTWVTNPAHEEWLVFYDDTKKALSYYNEESDITVNLWQEVLIRVKNITWSTISNWAVVYPTWFDSWNITVGLANASDKEKCRLIWVVTNNILNWEVWYVTKIWEVWSINTDSFNSWDIVYLSPTINWWITKIKPLWAHYITRIGAVKVKSAIGSIIVDIWTSEQTVEATQDVWFSTTDNATISTSDSVSWCTVTLSPIWADFCFYQYWDKYCKTTDNILLPDEEWMFVVYYNLWTLAYIKNPTSSQYEVLLKNNPVVAYVYWNATNNKSEYIGYELHTIGMNAITHTYLHFNFWARYSSWLALTDILSEQNWSLDSHAQFGVASWVIVDEDIYLHFPWVASTVWLPVFYFWWDTTTPTLRSWTQSWFSFLNAVWWRPYYNQLSWTNYVLTEVTDTDFVLYHIFVINENTPAKRAISIMWRNLYTSQANAIAWILSELQTLIPIWVVIPEIKVIWTVVLECRTVYTNSVNARIRRISAWVNYQDLRTTYFNWTSVWSGWWWTWTTVFSDWAFQIFDDWDITKIIQFEASWITTWNTRIISMPDKNVNLWNFVSLTWDETIAWNKTLTWITQIWLWDDNINKFIYLWSTWKLRIWRNTVEYIEYLQNVSWIFTQSFWKNNYYWTIDLYNLVLQTNNIDRLIINSWWNVSIWWSWNTYKLDVTWDINFTWDLYKNWVLFGWWWWLTWWASITWTSWTWITTTVANSASAWTIGQSIVIWNTQTQVVTWLKIDTWTSAQWHTWLLINAFNASAACTWIKIDKSTTWTWYWIRFMSSQNW